MKPPKITNVYPITLGRKGIDNFLFKYADGTIQPFLTEEEIKEWDILFPTQIDDDKTILENSNKKTIANSLNTYNRIEEVLPLPRYYSKTINGWQIIKKKT